MTVDGALPHIILVWDLLFMNILFSFEFLDWIMFLSMVPAVFFSFLVSALLVFVNLFIWLYITTTVLIYLVFVTHFFSFVIIITLLVWSKHPILHWMWYSYLLIVCMDATFLWWIYYVSNLEYFVLGDTTYKCFMLKIIPLFQTWWSYYSDLDVHIVSVTWIVAFFHGWLADTILDVVI